VTELRGPLYYCETRKHVARRADPIDRLVEDIIVARLALPDAAEVFARDDSRGRVEELRNDERRVRARLDGLAEAYAAGDIDSQALRAGSRRLRGRLEGVSQELTELLSIPTLAPLLTADDVAEEWATLDVDRKRAVIELLVEISIHPAGRGARVFDPTTVRVEWRTP
jgi:hypothetical protein